MHVNSANALLEGLRQVQSKLEELVTRAHNYDAPELAELIKELHGQVEVPKNWLRVTKHEGQKGL